MSGFRRRHAASIVALVILFGPSLMTRMAVLSASAIRDRTLTGHMVRRQAEICESGEEAKSRRYA